MSFSVNIQPQTKNWKFSFVYFYKSQLAFRFATTTIAFLSFEHSRRTRHVSFTPLHCERRHSTFSVHCQPMDRTEIACASAYVFVWVWVSECVCEASRGHAYKRDGPMERARRTDRTETNVCAGCVVNTWKCISETAEPRVFVFDSAFFFLFNFTLMCVFFFFSRCHRIGVAVVISSLLFGLSYFSPVCPVSC